LEEMGWSRAEVANTFLELRSVVAA